MNDKELENLEAQGWRFCAIPDVGGKPTKGPRIKDWQRYPLGLDQVPANGNIGVILGEASNGILAVDFDGPWTWQHWLEQVSIPFEDIDTVTWSSGRPGRAQMAFRVPEEYWHVMPTKFAISGPAGLDGVAQQLEFRWGNWDSGFQSVLPPSRHPEGEHNPEIYYRWDRSPCDVAVAVIPDRLLEFILTYQPVKRDIEIREIPVKNIEDITDDEFNEVRELLKLLKNKHVTIVDYAMWRTVTWAVYKQIGPALGSQLMQEFYPEQKRNEYYNLAKNYNPGRSPGAGTLRHLVRDLLQDRSRVKNMTVDQLQALVRNKHG
jgi:hypothetical protein